MFQDNRIESFIPEKAGWGKRCKRKSLPIVNESDIRKKETDVSDETFKTSNLGVLLPADQELNEIPFFQQCLMGICETAASKLYEVLVIMLEANDLSRVKRVVQENKVDGMIVTRALTNDPVIQYLESEHVPLAGYRGSEKDTKHCMWMMIRWKPVRR